MPNYVRNRITYEGNRADIDRMLKAVQEDGIGIGSIDFNKVLPMPESLNIESGSRTEDGLKEYRRYVEAKKRNADLSEFESYRHDYPSQWELGKTAYENLEKYGYTTWYEWCWDVWGTKWPAMEQNPSAAADDSFQFETAWSFPEGIVRELSGQYPKLTFTAQWADEDLGRNCGRAVYRGGEQTQLYCPDDYKDAIDLALDVWESQPGEWGLKLVKDRFGNETYEPVLSEPQQDGR